jgi:3-oxoacyl-[acyl-carrier-protein] synthase II
MGVHATQSRSLNRVVVTGVGVVSPVGTGHETMWDALCGGRSGISPVSSFDTEGFETTIAGEVRDFSPLDFMNRKDMRKTDRFVQFALAASLMAIEDSGLEVAGGLAEEFGVVIGSGIGGLQTIEEFHDTLVRRGPRKVSPFSMPRLLINMAPGQVSMRLGLKGPNESVVTACATGNHSLAAAGRMIRLGEARAMLAGATEAPITPMGVSGFNALKALSTRNDEPERASRPFDLERDGFVLAEGAGVLVLEEAGQAMARGAKIYAELAGWGATGDAYHITAPSPGGDGAVRCMRRALEAAGLDPGAISYINAHGTSTKQNDLTETEAIRTVFGPAADTVAVSSTKSMTGHLLGASSAIEAVASVLAIDRKVIPPTVNLEHPDPDCDLDYVPHRSREADVTAVLSNAFGFGGVNSSVVFREFSP